MAELKKHKMKLFIETESFGREMESAMMPVGWFAAPNTVPRRNGSQSLYLPSCF
ncbi:hypothetical protein BN949_02690 [Agrobacterium tumefaciens]|nr:hypothetical protein BN949_02690 [Agrobacterium tumefaciens]